jgi:hypothetical protein
MRGGRRGRGRRRGRRIPPYELNIVKPKTDVEEKAPEIWRVVSIDPGRLNLAIRVEERVNGEILTLLYEKVDVRLSEDEECNNVYVNITDYLNQHQELFTICNMLVIEKQIKLSIPNIRVEQHIVSYFISLFRNHNVAHTLWIYTIEATQKTRVFGGPTTRDAGKLWAQEYAIKLLTERDDSYSLAILDSESKKDDLCDVVCQIEALFKLIEK